METYKRVLAFLLTAVMIFAGIPFTGLKSMASTTQYVFPVTGGHSISQYFSSSHGAIDVANCAQQPVVATATGTVIRVENNCQHTNYSKAGCAHNSTCGNCVYVKHDVTGYVSVYGHLYPNSICVSVGEKVQAGQQIALVGSSGSSTNFHLHFEIRPYTNDCYNWDRDSENVNVSPSACSYIYLDSPHVTSPPTKAILTIDKTDIKIGETFKISVESDAICSYYCSIIDLDSKEYIYQGDLVGNSYESSFLKAGHYSACVSAYNDLGSVDSNWIDFYVFGEKPSYAILNVDKNIGELGDTFTITTQTDAYYNKIYISIFNSYDEVVYNGNISQLFSFTPANEGLFRAYVTAYTHEGGVDSNWITFSVGKYKLNYNSNGGSGAPSAQTKTYGTDLKLSTTIPTKANYNFIGWNMKADGTGTTYQPGDIYTENADVTLYAMWELAHSHSYTSSVTKQPTCTEKGIRKYTCSSCGDTYTEDIAALGHSHVISGITEPTCYESGFTTYDCIRCDNSYNTDFTDALNHPTSSWYTAINPTASSDGLAEKRCDKCGKVLDQFIIPALVPDYVTGVSLSSEKETVKVGSTFTLKATVTPDTAKNKNVIWTSRNPEIATVVNGKVTAVKPGTTAIVATTEDGGYIAFCLVRVLSLSALNGAVVNNDSNIVYGLSCNLNSVDNYLEPADGNMSIVLSDSVVGTGTTISVIENGEVVDSYTAVIFGDVDGNGWYDANDAFLVNMIASGLIDESKLSEAMRKAADCNHDGVINELDFNLLNQASLLLDDVDQSATGQELATNSVYIQYCSLIDQSAGMYPDIAPIPDMDGIEQGTTTPETNETVESNKPAEEMDFEVFFANIFEFIKKILSFIFSFII